MPCSRRLPVCLLLVALCTVARPPVGSATVVLPAEFGAMVAESQTIVHGVVSGVRSQMSSGRRSIESIVTLTVVTPLKGEERAAVVFRLPNGAVGRYRRITVGAPELSPGEEVIVFLEGRSPAMPIPFGLKQGVYRVERPGDGRALVTPLLAGDPGRVVRGDPARRPLALDAFAQRVRAMVVE
jgi:hypothetical protein